MSFISNYLKNYNLSELPESSKKNLSKLEQELSVQINSQGNPLVGFDDIVTKYGPQIGDIVERFAKEWKSLDGSISSIVGALKFVINIAVEVKQLVEQMKNDIINDEMTAEEKTKALEEFAKNLIFFIWKTVDPLKNRLTWLPFKQTIEKWLVMKIAEMAVNFAGDLLNKNFGSLSADSSIPVKVL